MRFRTALTPRRLLALAAAMLAIALVQSAPAQASANASVSFNVLRITGDGLGDKLSLRLHPGDASTLDLDFGDNGVVDGKFARNTFTSIVIDMGGGADSVRIDDSGGVFTDSESTEIFGGEGNDTLTGGGSNELLAGGGGDDTISTGGALDFPLGGPGDDTFLWSEHDGDDDFDGEEGVDRLLLDGSNAPEQFVIDRFPAPQESDVRISRNQGPSVLRLIAVEKLDLDSFGGNDSILASPDVGGLLELDIDAGFGSAPDDDVVTGSDFADRISGGSGADRLDGRGGNDSLNGGDGRDSLTGGPGLDALTGGAGADQFGCEGPDELLDPQADDIIPALCVAAEPAPAPAPAPTGTTEPAPPGSGLPAGFLGFGKPRVRATREGLRVTLANVHTAPIEVRLVASERLRAPARPRTTRYRVVRKTVPAGARVALRLRAPRVLRARIAARLRREGQIARRPTLTVTNVASGGKRTVRPRLTLKASTR
jgi:hypothetical protein